MHIALFLLCSTFFRFSQGSMSGPPVPLLKLPYNQFLLQEPPFQVESGIKDASNLPAISTVPLVMKMLFEQAEKITNSEVLPENGDFQSLARSIQPINVDELGVQRVILDFPALSSDVMRPGGEAWLVFQLRQSHILGKNCSQTLTVYENGQSKMRPVVTVPVQYKNDEPLLMVNITRSLRGWRLSEPSFMIFIKDSTSYTHDRQLESFSNYVDCSLAHVFDVLELRDIQSGPVLLLLSPELAVKKLMESQGGRGRFRRSVDSFDETTNSKENAHSEDHTADYHQTMRRAEVEDKRCHFHEWYVNTEQIGWDWLLFPVRIPLNLCVGKCPPLLDRHWNATSHAVARGLHRLVLGQESKPENQLSCCVPVKYRKFTMLIEKAPGVITLETSSDLSASQCGCR